MLNLLSCISIFPNSWFLCPVTGYQVLHLIPLGFPRWGRLIEIDQVPNSSYDGMFGGGTTTFSYRVSGDWFGEKGILGTREIRKGARAFFGCRGDFVGPVNDDNVRHDGNIFWRSEY